MNHQAAIEAVLFACGESISMSKLSEVIGIDTAACRQQVENMIKSYDADQRGIQIIQLNNNVQLCSKDEFADMIKRSLQIKRDSPLTPVTMEVLAIIAYNQPVTKGFIEQIRGVNSGNVVNNLVDKGLVEEAGRLDVPGHPISYKTTEVFLRSFGFTSIDDLPSLDDGEIKFDENANVTLDEVINR